MLGVSMVQANQVAGVKAEDLRQKQPQALACTCIYSLFMSQTG